MRLVGDRVKSIVSSVRSFDGVSALFRGTGVEVGCAWRKGEGEGFDNVDESFAGRFFGVGSLQTARILGQSFECEETHEVGFEV